MVETVSSPPVSGGQCRLIGSSRHAPRCREDRLYPRWSGAGQWYALAANTGIRAVHSRDVSGKPCSSSTGSPTDPVSRTSEVYPLVLIWRVRMPPSLARPCESLGAAVSAGGASSFAGTSRPASPLEPPPVPSEPAPPCASPLTRAPPPSLASRRCSQRRLSLACHLRLARRPNCRSTLILPRCWFRPSPRHHPFRQSQSNWMCRPPPQPSVLRRTRTDESIAWRTSQNASVGLKSTGNRPLGTVPV